MNYYYYSTGKPGFCADCTPEFSKSKPYKVRPEIYSTEPDSLTALPGSLFNSFLFRRYPP
nr:MAG TPA: Bromelain inhibitor VI [Herelleviridae sp.]